MADLTLLISITHERILLSDVELESITDIQFVNELVDAGIIPSLYNEDAVYSICNTNGSYCCSPEGRSLSNIGFKDGDTIIIRKEPTNW